jgi:alkylation response protein AidB-like acyl-CoA dehydrogenase
MPMLRALRRELDFQLFEVLGAERLCAWSRFAEHSADTLGAALDAAETLARQRYAPHHRAADEQEPRYAEGRAELPSFAHQAVRAFADGGFIAAAHDTGEGGMQLPFSVAMGAWGLFKGANIALEAYTSLTTGVANLIHAHATAAQKARYLPALWAGHWFGTMVLTEPQAGSSLADLRCRATPRPDGSYAIAGRKLFITAGDHDLSENIVHLVLARIDGAPAGVRGLSLFIVPKVRIDAEGRCGERNDVALAGLIHKLGFRGTTSAMLNFGEQGDCLGELLGAPNEGLPTMFAMMNDARINVGIGAAVLALAGYQSALAYARERRQGRIDRGGDSPPVAIVEHADVRRMLLQQKALAEGALALGLHAATLRDHQDHAPDAADRHEAAAVLDLLTPVVKAWCSQQGCAANDLAIQVLGGYGYTRDFAPEQHWRDNRLNPLHEGTNGIQALDLLGRKLGSDGGAAFTSLGHAVRHSIGEARRASLPLLHELAAAMEQGWVALEETAAALGLALQLRPRRALAEASPFMTLFGHSVVAWLWLRQAQAAARLLAERPEQDDTTDRCRGKLAAARHFFDRELAGVQPLHGPLRQARGAALDCDPAWL